MSDRKRPLEGGGESSVAKKLRSDTNHANESSNSKLSAADMIAKAKADLAAKMAKINASRLGVVPAPAPTPPAPEPVARPTPAVDTSDLARRVAEAKRRVAMAATKAAVSSNPYMSVPQAGKKKPAESAATPQGAGLKMAAHPLLLDTAPSPAPSSKKDKYKPMLPKFASIKANARVAPPPPPVTPLPEVAKSNPYASGSIGADGPKERVGRSFRFNAKGKYIALGNQLRQDAQLEGLKARIAESAKKAGLDSEFEVLEKNVRRPAPPVVEWWDKSLLPNKTYDDVTQDSMNIRNSDSPITIYVQHPIPIPAPSDKNKVELKPAHLTKKEQKKMRKIRRQAELQDRQDRIRMGLIPPDPPKVKLSNLMKVLTSDAVQDPTRVEAKVRREVAMRKHAHDKMNAERKLTDQQRKEKIENKKVEEERKGLVGALFKVKTLNDPAHKFKVRKNADQNNLSGLCIMHPAFSIVYVEGAARHMKAYKRLLLHRINWTQAARARDEDVVDDPVDADTDPDMEGSSPTRFKTDPESETPSLDDNRCDLVWEGVLGDRAFRTFKAKICPTDTTAKEALGAKLSSWWDTAKNFRPQEEELY